MNQQTTDKGPAPTELIVAAPDALRRVVREEVAAALADSGIRGPEEPLLTCADLARLIQRSPKTVPEWAKSRNIPMIRLTPREPRFYWRDVLDSLRQEAREELEKTHGGR